ncbi:TPA: stage V sporulation protein E [Candidatus Nomurabacteria bacterium]|nr:stage V sporulation protein E [Candidatus Nomurabacteria bacterium]
MFERIDKTLFVTIIIILFFGLIIFGSAALGVLSINEVKFYSVVKTQLIFALIGGAIALLIGMTIPYKFYQKHAYLIFSTALLFTALVFMPGLSRYHGGAHRWIDIGSFSLQPSEVLKLAFVIAVSAWCTKYRPLFKNWKYGMLPYMLGAGAVSLIMLLQPDFGTYLVIMSSSFVVYFVGGARKKQMYTLILLCIIGFITLIAVRPYMLERINTFFNSSQDIRGSSWQLNQSLIAIGSGGLFGRGLGQSVQKFNYLPEPIGDSIFAVLGEEIGFLGVIIIVILYGIVGIRGYIISTFAEDQFGRLLAIGIVVIIISQAMINIGSMLGILPLMGVPLPLVSHGGTALMAALFELGVLLNISKTSIIV